MAESDFTQEEIDRLDAIYKEDPIAFMEDCLWIQSKEGGIIPFRLNEPQKKLVRLMEKLRKAGKPIRIIILKARQIGFSTVIQAYMYWYETRHRHVSGLVIAHENSASANLWQKFNLFYEYTPRQFKVELKRKDEARGRLEFGTSDPEKAQYDPSYGSSLKIESAQDKQAGRSGTYHFIHASEVAFWPFSETFTALKQTIANKPNTFFILESTANGATGQFYEDWKLAESGKSDFVPVFVPWFEHVDYHFEMSPSEEKEWKRFRKALAKAVTDGGEDWWKHLKWENDRILKLGPEEMEMARQYPIDYGHIKWYRWALVNLCDNDPDKRSQEYPSSPDDAFLSTGRPFFDSRLLVSLKQSSVERAQRYTIDEAASLEQGRPVIYPDHRGELYVWSEPNPERSYSIGADVAEGTAEGDNCAAVIVDNETLEQCATLWGKMDPDVYGEKLFWLGLWYNEALLGVELNSSGTATVAKLEDLGYRNLWGKGYPLMDKIKEHGWRTLQGNRKLILSYLKAALKDGSFRPKMAEMIEEMLTFIVNDKGKPEAQRGKHDDLVMGAAIALKMREEALGAIPFMGKVSGVSVGRSG